MIVFADCNDIWRPGKLTVLCSTLAAAPSVFIDDHVYTASSAGFLGRRTRYRAVLRDRPQPGMSPVWQGLDGRVASLGALASTGWSY